MRGQDLTPWLVRYAYEQGAFPMTMEGGEVEWFQPRTRALFPLSGIRFSRSLKKTLRSGRYEVRFDTHFEDVMRGCLRPEDNWISEDFIRVYSEIFRQGWAHCSETWHDGELCGGVYGIVLGSCFCAESMFHRETDASKFALAALVNKCRESGFAIFDAQMMNPHLESLGAFEVAHGDYMPMLAAALKQEVDWRK